MMHTFEHLRTWVIPGALALGGVAVGLLFRVLVMPWLARLAARTPWQYDDVLVQAIRNPVVTWFIILGLYLAAVRLPFGDEAREWIRTITEALFILSVSWAAGRFGALAVQTASTHGARRGVSLIANVVRVTILLFGLLVVLDTVGVKMTAVLTTLGVGGVAVGLALQDTLTNFFAGIRILLSGKIRPGDFIRLDGGLEGTVHDIAWSQTAVLQSPNNLILVPNSRLGASVVMNFSLPDEAQNFTVPLTVARGSDLAMVEQVTLEVARETLKEVDEAVKDFEPRVRFDSFGDAGINVNVVLRTRHYDWRGAIIHALIKKLVARYRADGIELGAPLRAVISKDAPQSR